MDSPTVTSGLLHIRKRPGDASDIASSTRYIFCDGPRYSCGIGTRSPGVARKRSLLEHARDAGQTVMNVLLLSMPDYFENMPPVAVRMPNGVLTSPATISGPVTAAVASSGY